MRPTLLVAAFLLTAGPAAAQTEERACPSSPPDNRDGYAYCFVDDAMTADGLGEIPLIVRGAPGPVRQTLIQPRVAFVQEMLRSVENL